jgi:5-hydroxyisourate hydrolase
VSVITTHVLDLSAGGPAAGMDVRLERLAEGGGGWELLARRRTDSDGRVADWPGGPQLRAGRHRLTFATGPYFGARAMSTFYPEVGVIFEVVDATEHHHLPLLLSPFGYSTYRGT